MSSTPSDEVVSPLGIVRQTLQLPVKLWSEFGDYVRQHGISKSEGLRRALWVYLYLARSIDGGSEVVIHRPDGKEERLVISPY